MPGRGSPSHTILLLLTLFIAAPTIATPAAGAQQADSTRVAAEVAERADSVIGDPRSHPPISPRRAFLYSLLLPGLGQSKLERPTAGAILILVEAISIAMARKSAADLRFAERHVSDSVISGFITETDPVTGLPVVVDTIFEESLFSGDLVRARETHYEDWIALLVFNHLFSGADAFVAAHLWDLPGRLTVQQRRGGPDRDLAASVGLSFRW